MFSERIVTYAQDKPVGCVLKCLLVGIFADNTQNAACSMVFICKCVARNGDLMPVALSLSLSLFQSS
jgi:hypothetical protein